MSDIFDRYPERLLRPVSYGEVVDITSDDHEFTNPTRLVVIHTTGSITIRLEDNAADVTLPVVAGMALPMRVTHVRQTGTSAALSGYW